MSISVSNISAMRALPTTSFTPGVANTVLVETVGDYFRFKPGSTLTPVSNYVVASSDGLGQWLRLGIPNPTHHAATFWAVDPVSGNDENAGFGSTQAAADLVPLKTMAEWRRRVVGANYTGRGHIVVHVLSDSTNEDDANLYGFTTGIDLLDAVVIVGTPSVVFSGTVTGYTACTGNNRGQVVDSAVPISWTASGGISAPATGSRFIRKVGANVHAPVIKDLGSKTAHIGTPTSTSESSSAFPSAGLTNFTVGDSYEVVSLKRWPAVYCLGQQINVQVQCLDISRVRSGSTNSSGVFAAYMLCGFTGSTAVTLDASNFFTCVFLGGSFAGRGYMPILGCAFVATNCQIGPGGPDMNGSYNVFVNCELRVFHFGALQTSGTLAFFDNTTTCISCRHGSRIALDALTGASNTGKLITVTQGAVVTGGNQATATTTDANPFSLNGVSSASPPGADATSGGAIYQ